jgi:transcriptional regulator with GAF, ATPase, and Fis domain
LNLNRGVVMAVDAEVLKTGLEVIDLKGNADFQARPLRSRAPLSESNGIKRLARTFLEDPEDILQELVHVAVELCGADSAAISIIKENATDEEYYQWVASTGVYASFLNAMLPRYPSACGMCLERGRPQLLRVHKRFFDILGVEAQPVTDGLLLPWRVEKTEGTIFVLAHGRTEAFDLADCTTMESLADFAAMAVRQTRQRRRLAKQSNAAASAAMANKLAHEINNPLQSIMNLLYMAESNNRDAGERQLAARLLPDFERLTAIARHLLALPKVALDETAEQ